MRQVLVALLLLPLLAVAQQGEPQFDIVNFEAQASREMRATAASVALEAGVSRVTVTASGSIQLR